MNANMPAIEFEIDRLHKLCQAKDAEVARLTRRNLRWALALECIADENIIQGMTPALFARSVLNSGTPHV